MFTFTKKAADTFKLKWAQLEERSGDNWKVDLFRIGRYPVLLIVHEKTLFTLVRRKAEFKTVETITKEIEHHCPWYPFPAEISLGRNSDRRLSGSITEMRKFTWNMTSLDELPQLENQINHGLFSFLAESKYDYGKPIDALSRYRQRN